MSFYKILSFEILARASSFMKKMNPSIDEEKAKELIKKYTGFPSDPEDIDLSHTRLSWDEYFMSLAFLIAMRSPDAQTQHGCVIVDKKNKVVATGYNGFLQGAIDEEMPNLRPKKYLHIIHAEVNAVLSSHQDLDGCKAYVTGPPCNECLKIMARAGIKQLIVGDRPHVFSEGYYELQSLICAMRNIEIKKFSGKLATLDGRKISG